MTSCLSKCISDLLGKCISDLIDNEQLPLCPQSINLNLQEDKVPTFQKPHLDKVLARPTA